MNAIYELITRDARGPSVAVVYRSAVVIGLLITTFLTWEIVSLRPTSPIIGGIGSILASIVLYFLPVAVGAISVAVTIRYTRRIDFALLRTTTITPEQIRKGLVQGAIFHNRIVLALIVALLPLITIGWLAYQIPIAAPLPYCTNDCLSIRPSITGVLSLVSSVNEILLLSIANGSVCIVIWLTARAAIYIGVYLGLKYRYQTFALLNWFMLTLTAPACMLSACAFLYNGDMVQSLGCIWFYPLVIGVISFTQTEQTYSMLSELHTNPPPDIGGQE